MKAQRVIYHVQLDLETQDWQVLREGAATATSAHPDRCEAIKAARELAKAAKGCLVVHNPDGSIKREYTYGYTCFFCG